MQSIKEKHQVTIENNYKQKYGQQRDQKKLLRIKIRMNREHEKCLASK